MRTLLCLWLGLLPLFCWGADAAPSAVKAEAGPTARQLYRRGRISLEAKKYSEAINSFTSLIGGFPSDPLVPAARKYRAIAVRARKNAAGEAAKAAVPAQSAEPSAEKARLVLQPVLPAGKTAAEAEQDAPVKGDPTKCRSRGGNDPHPFCNWYDALAYCKGELPSVLQLQELNLAECPAGKRDGLCGRRYWSSEDADGARARTVIFGNGGELNSDKKTMPNIFVLCGGVPGN